MVGGKTVEVEGVTIIGLTLGIPIIAGRDFSDQDDATVPHSVVVDSEFVRMYFPDRSPIGQRIAIVAGSGVAVTGDAGSSFPTSRR